MFIRSIVASSLIAALATAQGVRERALQQPSAKFAATWSDEPILAADCINEGDTSGSIWGDNVCVNGQCLDTFCGEESDTTNDFVLSQGVALGKIKIPNNKEILLTLSAQINIFTLNTATSKKPTTSYYGNIGATSAMAGIDVAIYALPQRGGGSVMCAPGQVTMASRYVELRNRVGGNVTYTDCINDDPLDCEIKVGDLELESSIGIAMDTTAAHSFQWVCPNLPSDVYDIKAMFSLTADVNDLCDDTSDGDCSTINDLAAARVILGKRIMTIQQVRAVKGSLELE